MHVICPECDAEYLDDGLKAGNEGRCQCSAVFTAVELELVSADGSRTLAERFGQPPNPDQLPGYLNHSFYTWLQRNPEFTVRAVLPIVENGNTVLLHVWFD